MPQLPSSPPSGSPDTTGLTQSQAARNDIVDRAGRVTNQLVDVLTDLAFVKEGEVRARLETTANLLESQTLNISTIRERANEAAAQFTYQVMKLQGEADALRLALAHYDRMLAHYTWES